MGIKGYRHQLSDMTFDFNLVLYRIGKDYVTSEIKAIEPKDYLKL